MKCYEEMKSDVVIKSIRYGMDVFISDVLDDLMHLNSARYVNDLRHGAFFYAAVSVTEGKLNVIETDGIIVPELELFAVSDKSLEIPAYLIGRATIETLRKQDYDLFTDYSGDAGNMENYRGPLGICIIISNADGRLFFEFKSMNPVEETRRMFEIVLNSSADPETDPIIDVLDSYEDPPAWTDAFRDGVLSGISCFVPA